MIGKGKDLIRYIILILLTFLLTAFQHKPVNLSIPPKIAALISIGDKKTLHEVGVAYHTGDGVSVNLVEAAKWYLEAANKGNVHSHYQIWRLWENFSNPGLEPPFDYEQFRISRKMAIAGYERMAKKKPHPETYYRLGLLYDPGVGIGGAEAALSDKYLAKAAEMGHEEAKEMLKFSKELKALLPKKLK